MGTVKVIYLIEDPVHGDVQAYTLNGINQFDPEIDVDAFVKDELLPSIGQWIESTHGGPITDKVRAGMSALLTGMDLSPDDMIFPLMDKAMERIQDLTDIQVGRSIPQIDSGVNTGLIPLSTIITELMVKIIDIHLEKIRKGEDV